MPRTDNILLETERLILRRVTLADLDDMARLNGDPAVMRYIGDGAVWTRAQSEARIRRIQKIYDIFPGLGLWVALEKPARRFIGNFALIYVPKTTEVEVGYRLRKSAWGRGLATEGARALVRYGMHALGLDRVVGLTHPDNEASKQVLMKAGLKARGVGHYYGKELPYFVAEKSSDLLLSLAVRVARYSGPPSRGQAACRSNSPLNPQPSPDGEGEE